MTSNTAAHPTVRLQRRIPASPALVYRAWLEPDLLERWLAPGEWEVTRVEVDERVGGRFRVWQRSAQDHEGGFECELLELSPSERIVYRWGFAGPARTDGPVYDSLLTITLSEAGDGETLLTLVHERLDTLAAALPSVADQVAAGWASVLERLVSMFGQAS